MAKQSAFETGEKTKRFQVFDFTDHRSLITDYQVICAMWRALAKPKSSFP
jgi:hypothetical protein